MGSEKRFKAGGFLCGVVWGICLGGISANVFGDTEKMLMTFEEFLGQDGAEIGDFYPGVRFEQISTGWDWVVSDVTTGNYNASSWPSQVIWGCDGTSCGRFWMYDSVCAWTGVQGEGGRIVFENPYVFSVEVGYSCGVPLTLEAYDANDILLDSDTGPANLRGDNGGGNQEGPGVLRADAPPGKRIHSVVIHDTGNLWLVDNIRVGSRLDIVKFDDVNELSECVSPEEVEPTVTYTIGVASKYRDHTNIFIVDHLPKEADFVEASPEDSNYGYDLLTHTYTWHLDELAGYEPPVDPNIPFDPNTYFTLTVRVSDRSEPAGWMVNEVIVESDQWDGCTKERTPICCWGGQVIYVDCHAPGTVQNGTCWAYAYRDLQRALARAQRGCGSEIWVADGVYRPGDSSEDTFKIPDGVLVYGGYAGYGASDPDARDWKTYRTILSGYIDETTRSNTVVTMGDNSLLDGVTVEEGNFWGIYGKDTNYSLNNCIVKNQQQKGIYCENGDLIIKQCRIKDNGWQGIHHYSNGNFLRVENCTVHANQRDGILTEYSNSTILNSVIYQNGSGSTYYNMYYGINIVNPGASTTIRNNTIVHNAKEGIRRTGGATPTVKNNIVYFNNEGGAQLINISPTYCCVQNWSGGTGNISSDPQFAYSQPPYGYYHIRYESPCRNAGDYGNYPNETDMDGQPRVQENRVDIGADEVSCEDTWHEHDWTYDGVITYQEFAIFSRAWLSRDPNDPSLPSDPNLIDPNDFTGWNPICNLDQTGDSAYRIDIADLAAFCAQDSWLWEACWREDYWDVWGMKDDGGARMLVLGEGEEMTAISMMKSFTTPSEQSVCKPDSETLAKNILLILEEVDKIMEEEPENYEALNEMKVFLEEVLRELKNGEG